MYLEFSFVSKVFIIENKSIISHPLCGVFWKDQTRPRPILSSYLAEPFSYAAGVPWMPHHMSGGANYLPRFLPISFFQVCISFYRCFGTFASNKENPSVYWHATLSCPLMASNYATLYLVPISFLISFWLLTMPWISYLISFFRRASRFIAFQTIAAQKSHRKIAVTTVAASGLATISLQKSQGFFALPAAKKIASR